MEQRDLERLQLAFAHFLAQSVAAADGVVDDQEASFVRKAFPAADLAAVGFVDANGNTTPALDEAVEESLRVLPTALSAEQKHDLMTVLAGTRDVSGDADEREGNVLVVAARLLGVNPADWS